MCLPGGCSPRQPLWCPQIVGTYARLLKFERKVREQEGLEARLAVLEEGAEKRWGA
jgi:hypothetical protein